jgi:hypothetical protein
MDIVFDPPGSGMFTEVYLYEEQMEADLHAIVSRHIALHDRTNQLDSIWSTLIRRPFPIVHLPDPMWTQSES